MRLYVDSNVLLSYFKREMGGFLQFQAERAECFLLDSAENEWTLVISNLTLYEITKNSYLTKEEITSILRSADLDIVQIGVSKGDWTKAQAIHKRMGIHHPDSLHAQLALKLKCDAIVTWNLRDFKGVSSLIRVCTPDSVKPSRA